MSIVPPYDPVQKVLSLLKNVKRVGEKQWMACCPAHPDNNPSLSVGYGDDGRALIHCHSNNCRLSDIVSAIGLCLADLFVKNPKVRVLGKQKIPAKQTAAPADPDKSYRTLEEFVLKLGNRYGGTWVYPAVNGINLAVVRKNAMGDEKKSMIQLHSVPDGWTLGKPDGPTPLLYSDTFGDANTIYLLEGEGCADAGAAIGLIPSTTWAGGCKAVQKSDWSFAAGKNLVIFADNDKGGEGASNWIAKHTTGLEPPARVKIIRLPDLPEGGDIVDYIAARNHLDSATIRQGILEIIEATAEWTPESAEPSQTVTPDLVSPDGDRIRRMRFSAINLPWTELWVARKLVILHGNDIRFCKALGWLVWTGIRWERDDTGEISRRAKDTIRKLYGLAQQISDDDERKKYLRFVISCETRAKIDSITELAKSESEIAVRADIFDADPWALNVANGTIDLRTGVLRPHRREDYCTKLAPVDYNLNTKCPRFDQFMEEIFSKNQAMIAFADRSIGHMLTGVVQDHILHIWYGTGSNGKSLLTETILEALGDYGLRAPSKLLIMKRNEGHSTDKAALAGARFVSSSESGEGQELDEEFIKALTGGDRVTARFCHKDNFSFPQTWKIALFTNCKPIVRGQDHGTWRRLRIWPFLETFVDAVDPNNPLPGEKDTKLADKLRAEHPGILARWVRGCLEWQQIGLDPPEIVMLATEAFREECDLLGAFITECCEMNAGLDVPAGVLYGCYRIWAIQGGLRPMSIVTFSRRLLQRPGIDRIDERVRRYTGLIICEGWREKWEASQRNGNVGGGNYE